MPLLFPFTVDNKSGWEAVARTICIFSIPEKLAQGFWCQRDSALEPGGTHLTPIKNASATAHLYDTEWTQIHRTCMSSAKQTIAYHVLDNNLIL